MNRIRLVWSSIWNVLSDYFVTIGCSENLSIAIFAMDSLRQLSMKFLEREELANYNFQNEFMKPFVIVMRKCSAVEIRELIIRCVSQMVLSRVKNVKSGWKSMFMVYSLSFFLPYLIFLCNVHITIMFFHNMNICYMLFLESPLLIYCVPTIFRSSRQQPMMTTKTLYF